MKNFMSLEERAERVIELIEQDDSMTYEEKRRAIRDIYEELRDVESD